jgi:hypothetical protein
MSKKTLTPESALKKSVSEYLAAAGWRFLRINTGVLRKGSRFIHLAPEGTADVVVFPPYGLPKWVELKAPGQKTATKRKEAQAAFCDEVRALGHGYAICESLDDVKAVLAGVVVREV